MKKKRFPTAALTFFLVAGLFLSVGCGSEEGPFVAADYSSWTRLNRRDLDYPVPGQESRYRVIYINTIGGEAEVEEREGRVWYSYPKGTVIAKEVYPTLNPSPDTEPILVTAMMKDPEHENAQGGWVWLAKNLKTQVEEIMEVEFCFTCHLTANEPHPYSDGNPEGEFRDYVFFARE